MEALFKFWEWTNKKFVYFGMNFSLFTFLPFLLSSQFFSIFWNPSQGSSHQFGIRTGFHSYIPKFYEYTVKWYTKEWRCTFFCAWCKIQKRNCTRRWESRRSFEKPVIVEEIKEAPSKDDPKEQEQGCKKFTTNVNILDNNIKKDINAKGLVNNTEPSQDPIISSNWRSNASPILLMDVIMHQISNPMILMKWKDQSQAQSDDWLSSLSLIVQQHLNHDSMDNSRGRTT